MSTVAANTKVVEATGTALNERDFETYEALHAEDFLYIGPDHPEGLRGARALTLDLKSWLGAFPDLTVDTEFLIGQGDWVCWAGSMCGTNTGPLPMPEGDPRPPTNKRIAIRQCVLFKVVDGKILEQREYFDTGAMAALGI